MSSNSSVHSSEEVPCPFPSAPLREIRDSEKQPEFTGFVLANSLVGHTQNTARLVKYSTGLLGVDNRLTIQPFVEGGYYSGNGFVMAGIRKQESTFRGVYGAGYRIARRLLFTAVSISNDSPRHIFGYGVLSWNVKVW